MNHTPSSPLFDTSDLRHAEADELVRRLQTARGMGSAPYERLRQHAEQVAREATRFNAALMRDLLALGVASALVSNATLTALQMDFILARMAASAHGELLRDAITIPVRRGVFHLSGEGLHRLYDAAARLAEEAKSRASGAHHPKQIRAVLDAIADARMQNLGPEAERVAALEAYRRQEMEIDPKRPRDRAATFATSSPHITIDQLLLMQREYPNEELVRGMFHAATERPALLMHLPIRTAITQTFGGFRDVAVLLATHPHPIDFNLHYSVLERLDNAEQALDEAFGDVRPERLQGLGENILARLLESPSRRVRELAIAAIGPVRRESARTR